MSTENRLLHQLQILCAHWESGIYGRSECADGISEAARQLRELLDVYLRTSGKRETTHAQ